MEAASGAGIEWEHGEALGREGPDIGGLVSKGDVLFLSLALQPLRKVPFWSFLPSDSQSSHLGLRSPPRNLSLSFSVQPGS